MGVYRVEINDTVGAAVINVPVFVGVPFQAEVAEDGSVSRALEALQQVRQSHGLAPYKIDARLEKVAHDHVDDILAHKWICHCWADGSSLLDHVRAAGITPAEVTVPGHPNQFSLGVGNGISTAPGAAAIRGASERRLRRVRVTRAWLPIRRGQPTPTAKRPEPLGAPAVISSAPNKAAAA